MVENNAPDPSEVEKGIERLAGVIAAHGPMVIAFSGGVDSALLAYVAHRTLGERMEAVIGVSPSLAAQERREAVAFLERHGIPYSSVEPGEIDDDRYRANGPDRCFFCKEALFTTIEASAARRRFGKVAYGANADDGDDYRPGARSAAARGVAAPLAEAGFTKAMVRAAARALGLEVWDKPAAPCLASRIPYHAEVTREKLRAIEAAEAVLDALGFRERRVRHRGAIAHVELPVRDHARANRPEVWREIVSGIEGAGFEQVVLVADGLRSGRLNEALGRA